MVEVGNTVSGTVTGPVVQAHTIGQVVLTPPKEAPLVPRQLPPTVRGFAGRAHHLAMLDALLPTADTMSVTPATVIVTLDGTAGVGKTTLAVQWAHRVQHHFPDGTLFANLRGYGPSAPLAPHLVLTGFLMAFGVSEERIPADLDQQCAVYRSLLAERRVLVVLDNAGNAEQVRPLLPGSLGSLVLVTSRANLIGLAVIETATPLVLNLFTTAEAHELVATVIGAQRAAAEAEAVTELIRVCAHLPLALRVAATRIAAHQYLEVADVVEEIREGWQGLGALTVPGDQASSVSTVFDWSYSRLPPAQARMFRLLGLHPGVEFGVHAAAAVAGVELREARRLVEALAAYHLIEPAGRRRYRFHDLLHAYAAHRAECEEQPGQRRGALMPMLTWYARTAMEADRQLFPGTESLCNELGEMTVSVPVTSREEAVAWLRTEHATLWAVQRLAAGHGQHGVVVLIASAARFLTLGPRTLWRNRLEAEEAGLASARACGDRVAEAFLLLRHGGTCRMLGDLPAAEADFTASMAVAEELGDPAARREALCALGLIRRSQERLPEARAYYTAALPLAQTAGKASAEAVVVCNLSQIAAEEGDFDTALAHAETELALRREVGAPNGIAYALHDIAVAHQGRGDHDTAIELCHRGLAQYRELAGTESSQAMILETLAASLIRHGRQEEAVRALGEAAVILTELDESRAEQLHRRAAELAEQN
ncbi:tetratricopeptide repeat protein [Crossiella sp. SN42]|uniref:ATP-binding protein n=1 Tax=Crossiella sp. SN42 TaxID=2944808 RepID=UPI00207CB56D|nr:tetratricopeptide repeat protein [Crossiella sp. SN42]MCO1578074.1 tetratricopeptide repeat protein [Crossiella sp. SN42]